MRHTWNRRWQAIVCLTILCSVIGRIGVVGYVSARSSGAVPHDHLVAIVDRGIEQTVYVKARTVRQALQVTHITIDEAYDRVQPSLGTSLDKTTMITITRAQMVTIVDGSRRMKIFTAQRSPRQIAQQAGLTIYKEDTATMTKPIADIGSDGPSALLTITRSPQRTVTREEPVAFPIETIKDKTRFIGDTQIKQAGQPGIRTLTFMVSVENGIEVGRKTLSSVVTKQPVKQIEVVGTKPKNPLTKSKGAHIFTDSKGVAHRETYYDLPMNVAMGNCGGGSYTIREDGAKVDKDGYILVAANYGNYPRCSVVETSMGPGKVYDTGGFATRYPHGFDLATDWTKGDGR